MNSEINMENLNIIGDPNPKRRKLVYDPDLADKVNKETEAEIRKKQLEAKLKKKKLPKEPPAITTPPPILTPSNLKYSFLEGDFGKTINEKVQAKYGTYESISKIQYDDKDKIVKGTTPFYIVAVNELFQEEFPQFRTATQADLERILKANALQLQGNLEDSSLVLRTKQEPNKYLAEDLFNQFKDKGINLKENSAYVIPLHTLKLRKDEQSKYKLSFDITDLTLNNYFEAPILMSESGIYINPAEINENTGLPIKVYSKAISGDRQLWTINSGLSRLILNWNLVVNSYYEYLANSNDNGRVVVVSAEGTAQNFSAKNP